nr:MAG TPA: hypothetical protein [Caudoviricetes sp.]
MRFRFKKNAFPLVWVWRLRRPPARHNSIKIKKEEEKLWRFINQVTVSRFYHAGT